MKKGRSFFVNGAIPMQREHRASYKTAIYTWNCLYQEGNLKRKQKTNQSNINRERKGIVELRWNLKGNQ